MGKHGILRILVCLWFVVLVATTVWGFTHREWLPELASEHGRHIDTVINYLVATTGAIFVIGHLCLIAFVWKYTGRREGSFAAETSRTEWLVAIVPALLISVVGEFGVLALGGPAWDAMYGDAPADAVAVEVTGKQFEWITRYPGKDGKFGRVAAEFVDADDNPLGLDEDDPAATDDVVVRGALHVPADRPVLVQVRSHDVLHSLTIPLLRVKQDAIPGFVTQTRFTVTKTGSFEIACAELCGLGHYRMRAYLKVAESDAFDAWLAGQTGWFE